MEIQEKRFNPYSTYSCSKKVIINNIEYEICGNSVASIMTGFYIPQLKIMFDAGTNSPYAPKYICITHLHGDHIQSLPAILTGLPIKPIILCPIGTKKYIYNFLIAYERMTKYKDNIHMGRFENKFELHEMNVGDSKSIDNNKIIITIKTYHGNVETLGYGIIEKRRRLKDEYRTCTKEEIIELKKNKITIDDEYIVPILLYTGDTTIDWISTCYIDFPLIITESTFIKNVDKSFNEDANHQTLEEMMKYANEHKNKKFILTHFSPRYIKEDIISEIAKYNLDNVYIII